MPPAIAPRALFGKNRLSQIPRGIFFFLLSWQTNIGNANKKQISNSNFSFFFERVVNVPIVNGRTCTSCEEAYVGASKTAWELGFIPQRGITYSIET